MDDKYREYYEHKKMEEAIKKIESQFHPDLGITVRKNPETEKWHSDRTKQFNKHREKEEWHHEQVNKLKKTKPDPATVEAELQREEELWDS